MLKTSLFSLCINALEHQIVFGEAFGDDMPCCYHMILLYFHKTSHVTYCNMYECHIMRGAFWPYYTLPTSTLF